VCGFIALWVSPSDYVSKIVLFTRFHAFFLCEKPHFYNKKYICKSIDLSLEFDILKTSLITGQVK